MSEQLDRDNGVLPAGGTGRELFDDPTLFFLTHEDSIRRWSELSSGVRRATQEYLLSLQPDLEAFAEERGLKSVSADTAGAYHHQLLCYPHTPLATDGTPAIAFCLGWNSNRVRMSRHTHNPF